MSLFKGNTTGNFLSKYRAPVIVFTLCFCYWAYLVSHAEMAISADAVGYERLGQLVNQSGWKEFLRTGPNREPFYPWLVATSMGMADKFSISYQLVQKWVQVLFLFASQLLVLIMLNKLKISSSIKWAMVLYFGLSPALVNAAFSLFSEVATFPFVPLMILACVWSWRIVCSGSYEQMVGMAVLTAGIFLLASGTKSAFMYVFFVCLIPFVCTALRAFQRKSYKESLNAAVYVVVSFCILTTAVMGYMSLNRKYNGYFQVNDRNASTLLNSAYKRSNLLTPRIVLVHLSTIPGNGICQKLFKKDECRYADWYGSYDNGEIMDFLKNVPKEQQDSKTFRLAMAEIGKHPFQQSFFTFVEAAKMPFWESTQIGFVGYPPALTALFDNVLFKNGLRLLVSLLTVVSLVFLVFSVWRDRSLLFEYSSQGENMQIRLFVLLVIGTFTGLYALCYVVTRYALPIGSLYLVSIAYYIQSMKQLCQQAGTNKNENRAMHQLEGITE